MNKNTFYTKSMAKVYAKQGNFKKAAEIYKYLLEQKPDKEISDELNKMETAMADKNSGSLADLFAKWFRLAAAVNYIKKLKHF